MSATTIDILAEGFIPSVEGAILTVPAGEVWVVLSIDLGNENGTTQLVHLWARPVATNRLMATISMPLDYTANLEGNLVLEAGGTIRGDAGQANSVAFIISGYKITP